ncbi:conjugal transfer protein TraD [Sphingomonas sp. HF-S4]|uniref:Conjugal transfer protein TraD n=1 Tax=Sphingomonas agrestis TaxID=3080540 RepID=A0ABU3YDK6_9SPHN|nr:conjugal transfer protein TraD [Sphingomonas sp. HF-S4]MDV3459222.1 conjugal transfer protein TraD [Sphingomonas sp. HF-S4]
MAARNRLQIRTAREDKRAWVVKRRERTRQLIELGGLVAKAGLVDLVDDDRAVIFGILSEAAARIRSEEGERLIAIWHRRGIREFAQAKLGSDRR